jgi:hypothetical protein
MSNSDDDYVVEDVVEEEDDFDEYADVPEDD